MARKSSMMNGGAVWAGTAQALNGQVVSGISAAGTTQAGATALTGDVNVVTTTGSGAGVVVMATLDVGDSIVVANLGANGLAVYPPSGGAINGGSANAAVSVAAGKVATVIKTASTAFIAQVGA